MFELYGAGGDREATLRQGGGHLGGGCAPPRPPLGCVAFPRERPQTDGGHLPGETARE
jgi:hypothetical protein